MSMGTDKLVKNCSTYTKILLTFNSSITTRNPFIDIQHRNVPKHTEILGISWVSSVI